jgi:hypothetical protein
MADVTMLISSNEGWGLSLTESMMAGTMILGNVSGGMQDQMRFEDEEGNWIKFTKEFPSNHFARYKTCGSWVKPIFPSNMSLAGSVPTPYIYDDRVNFITVSQALMELYEIDKEEIRERGKDARKWVTSEESGFTAENMCSKMIEGINETFERFNPRESHTISKVEDIKPRINKYLVY